LCGVVGRGADTQMDRHDIVSIFISFVNKENRYKSSLHFHFLHFVFRNTLKISKRVVKTFQKIVFFFGNVNAFPHFPSGAF
jgi:hypothetical protein